MTANRLPGLQSSKQNLEQENEVYDGMMLDVVRLLVLPPLTGCLAEPGLFEVSTFVTISATSIVDGTPCILLLSRSIHFLTWYLSVGRAVGLFTTNMTGAKSGHQ